MSQIQLVLEEKLALAYSGDVPGGPEGGVLEVLVVGEEREGLAERVLDLHQLAPQHPPHSGVAELHLLGLLIVELEVQETALLEETAALHPLPPSPPPASTAHLFHVPVEVLAISPQGLLGVIFEVFGFGREKLVPDEGVAGSPPGSVEQSIGVDHESVVDEDLAACLVLAVQFHQAGPLQYVGVRGDQVRIGEQQLPIFTLLHLQVPLLLVHPLHRQEPIL